MTDEELFIGCRKGRSLHRQLLVERYASMLFTVARRYTGNDFDAQDVLQDSFVKILKALKDNYKEQGKPEQWMRTVVINTALNMLDKKAIKKETDLDKLPEISGGYIDALTELGLEELMNLIASLPDGYRQIFNLAVIEEYPHKIIAEMLNITESTSRSQLARARKMLQLKIRERENIGL